MIKKIINKIKVYIWKKKGFNNKNVYRFLEDLDKDNKLKCDKKTKKFAHKHGFFASTVIALKINEKNYKNYLSDYDYWRMFPLDKQYHSWIDNKLEIKYLLGDLSNCMPEYYFQIENKKSILKLMDCPNKYKNEFEDICSLLKSKKTLGIKAVIGYGGANFYKAEYKNNKIYVNDKIQTEEEFIEFLKSLKNYLIMEYLDCSGIAAQIYPKTANSIRYIIGIENNKQYKISRFIKFGDSTSGYVDNLSSGGITCPIDENGFFEYGYTKKNGILEKIQIHPDTKVKLEGKIIEWTQIEELTQKILNRLPQLKHVGFDYVITQNGIKLLEINDMSGLLTTQKHTPLLKNKKDNYYLIQIEKINKEKRG